MVLGQLDTQGQGKADCGAPHMKHAVKVGHASECQS